MFPQLSMNELFDKLDQMNEMNSFWFLSKILNILNIFIKVNKYIKFSALHP